MKTIVILGQLDNGSEQSGGASVFTIPNGTTSQYVPDLIRITGDPALAGAGNAAALKKTSGGDGRVLFITGNKTKIQLDNIEISGGYRINGAGIFLESGAQLTIEEGAVIKNNVNRRAGGGYGEDGGGLWVENASLKMTGGSITDNHADDDTGNGEGGGVFMTGNSTFLFVNGSIYSNSAKHGGGVCMYGGTFTMLGGDLSGNWTTGVNTAYGGGVAVHGGTFIMSGGSISGNIHNSGNSARGGGGVAVMGGTFRMGGTALIGNVAANGGVVATTASPGRWDGNYSKSNGGGVYRYSGTSTLDTSQGAQIIGNKAPSGDDLY